MNSLCIRRIATFILNRYRYRNLKNVGFIQLFVPTWMLILADERNLTVSSSLSLSLFPLFLSFSNNGCNILFWSRIPADSTCSTLHIDVFLARESILLRPKKILNGITYIHEGVTPASVSKSEIKGIKKEYTFLIESIFLLDIRIDAFSFLSFFLSLSLSQIYILLAVID